MWFFRAVAFDLDGTLASGGRLGEGVLAAIQAARAQRLMVLVTGRILEDLEAAFPGLASRFDAVVAETGAVLSTRLGSRPLAAPVDPALARALAARGVATWSGRVLLALDGADAGLAREVAAALGVDCRLVRNRGAAMILPAGVTKGSGLLAALEEFGLSAHNVIAVGDAENDLALLQAAEVGVAVANAVPSLAAHADLRLGLPDGAGVAQLLGGPLLSGTGRLCPPRRWVPIGNFADGEPARLPGSQASVLVIGDAGSGASHLAGLLAERWIDAGYAVLVLDPEGDHVGLAQRPGVHLVDAAAAHPTGPSDVLARMRTCRCAGTAPARVSPASPNRGFVWSLANPTRCPRPSGRPWTSSSRWPKTVLHCGSTRCPAPAPPPRSGAARPGRSPSPTGPAGRPPALGRPEQSGPAPRGPKKVGTRRVGTRRVGTRRVGTRRVGTRR